MTNKQQCCKTCIHSRWWLTATGRIKRDHAGDCKAEFIYPKLPACIPAVHYTRCGVWPDEGTDCPLYMLNEGKPISETTP